jgi:hypothetical protein
MILETGIGESARNGDAAFGCNDYLLDPGSARRLASLAGARPGYARLCLGPR